MRGFVRVSMRIAALSGSSLATATAFVGAAAAAQPAIRTFDLPAQDAAAGVPAFARQADLQLVISATASRAHRTNAVHGTFTAAEALRRLLDGTGLVAAPAPNGAAGLIIRATAAATSQAEPAQTPPHPPARTSW